MRIALVAGETSGDQLGAGLITELRSSYPDADYYGIGGPLMQQAGMQLLYNMEDISMIGLEGVFTKLPKILSIRKKILNQFINDKPDIFIGIDVPDFNLGLEKKLTAHSITCIHYVSPTIWAWRGHRVKHIKQAIAHMLVLFPFEKKLYDSHNIPATFVGHPIADEVDLVPDLATCREKHSLSDHSTLVALLPGSRDSEIQRHAQLFLDTARSLSKTNDDIEFVISAVNQKTEQYLSELIRTTFSDLNLKLVTGNVREVISASNLVLAASGTVTLETALMGKPLVMAYKVSKLSEWMVKYFAQVNHYAMPNFLLDEPEIPEFVQQNATVENLAQALQGYLSDSAKCDDIISKFNKIKQQLKVDANIIAAAVVRSYLRPAQ